MVKSSYKNSLNKRAVQEIVYSSIRKKYKNLIALGGPDLSDYLLLVKTTAGIKNAIIYEYSPIQLLRQISNFKRVLKSTEVIYGDILQAKVNKDTFYDFDFCCSVKTAVDHIKKFKDCPAMFTFSIRPISLKNSIQTFMAAYTGNNRITYTMRLMYKTAEYKRFFIMTSNNRYMEAYIYTDSCAMLVITTVNNH